MPTLWTKNPRLVQTIDTTAFGTDGIGGVAQTLVVTLTGNPALTQDDILII